MLNPLQTYYRKKQILYDLEVNQVLKFVDKMPDMGNTTGDLVENMNKYIERYPERIEIITNPIKEQLTLF